MSDFDSLDDFFVRGKVGDSYTIPLAEWMDLLPLPDEGDPPQAPGQPLEQPE